jgi:hypothetical protein
MPFTIAQFYISDDNLLKFRRLVKKPRDCVINALELLGVLEAVPADLMRIVVGDTGINASQIEQIFSYVQPSARWRFFRYTDIKTLEQFAYQGLQPSHVIFCGYQKNGFKHVFIVGKNHHGQILYIDPQVDAFCPLEQPQCFNYIRDAQEYYILQSTFDLQQIKQLQQAQQGMQL